MERQEVVGLVVNAGTHSGRNRGLVVLTWRKAHDDGADI